jgi:hypothetical protein
MALPAVSYADPPPWAHRGYHSAYDQRRHDHRRHEVVVRDRYYRECPVYVQTYAPPPTYYDPPPRYLPVRTAPPVPGCGGNVLGAMVGGATGGFLGTQIGKGDGNLAATAAGAVLGAIVSQHLGNPGC